MDYRKLKIDTDVPAPNSGCIKWPWDRMEVGDSVLVGCTTHKECIRARSAAQTWGANNGIKFRTRTTNKTTNIRIWRTE